MKEENSMNTETLINQFKINPYDAIQLMVEEALVLEGKTPGQTPDQYETYCFRWYRNTFQKNVAKNLGCSPEWFPVPFESILRQNFRLPEPAPEKKVWDFERSSRYLGHRDDNYKAIDLPFDVPPNRKFKVHLEIIPD
jgi:hypothetical protein